MVLHIDCTGGFSPPNFYHKIQCRHWLFQLPTSLSLSLPLPTLPPSLSLSLSLIISTSINNSLMLHTFQQEFHFYLSPNLIITRVFILSNGIFIIIICSLFMEYGQIFTLQLHIYDMGFKAMKLKLNLWTYMRLVAPPYAPIIGKSKPLGNHGSGKFHCLAFGFT